MTLGEFQKKYGARVLEAEPLSKHTSFHVGGKAKWYFEAKTSDELAAAAKIARASKIPSAILGGGSNSLFSDAGFDGLVIVAGNRNFEITDDLAWAEAGVVTAVFARALAAKGFTGFEWAVTLPGTIGGAVRGNAGCFGGEIKDSLLSVMVSRGDEEILIRNKDCGYAYRESIFKHNDDLILQANFEFRKDDPVACLARIEAVMKKRQESQPLGKSSAGCMFKNFEFKDEQEIKKLRKHLPVPDEFIKSKRIPAGWLIQEAGLKGFCVGGACVSEAHGNFLVNSERATADHVLQLVAAIKTKIRDEYGIQLQEEVQCY